MSESHGKVWWNELNTRDTEGAKAYYGSVCGWSFDTMPMQDGSGDYIVAKIGDDMVCGIFDLSLVPGLDEVPSHWMTYFAVDDVDVAASETEAAGGQVMRPPWDVKGVGRISTIKDPTGAVMGLMTPATDG